MKILVGVDDSTFSHEAVQFIIRNPWPKGTRVTVLAAARAPLALATEVYAPGLSYNDDVMRQELKAHGEVARRAEEKLRAAGLETEVRVTVGDPRIEIVDTAEKQGVDLVVVGSHGRTGLSRLLLGSVATYVMNHAPCSVLVVKKRS